MFKDVFPRFKTMRGHFVPRKGGWDCHGLPVELEIEKELGFQSKEDIERYGVAEFNAKCRESVLRYIDEWNALTERIGFWLDTEHAYFTLSNDYIESVWWSLKETWQKGLLTEGHKVVPYCPRCGTALSSHEVAQGYEDVVDPSVYVRFPLLDDPGVSLLAWTTMPWTLVPHAAIAVDPEVTYVRARLGDERLILAEALVERVLGAEAEIEERMPGRRFSGCATSRRSPTSRTTASAATRCWPATSCRSRTAPAWCTPAPPSARTTSGSPRTTGSRSTTRFAPTARFDERAGPFAGMYVRAADAPIVEALRESGRLFRAGEYEHAYPHCWRCGTPLIYYAKTNWYVRTTEVKDELLAANEAINWYPEHIKHGRFGNWLENNVDWALRASATGAPPLPIWRCEEGHVVCVGSRAELEERGGEVPEDLHRPYIDEVSCAASCGEEMRRVPDLIDVWWDSGCMPFAQWHAPFENEETFRSASPPTTSARGSTRRAAGSTRCSPSRRCCSGDASYETVLCLGLILDADGQKMSKSKGNVVVPWDVIDAHGADAFRWYYFTSKQPWDGYRFSLETVGESVRQFLKTLWNTYGFFVLYANVNDVARRGRAHRARPLDPVAPGRHRRSA